jgi:hypothetical protein
MRQHELFGKMMKYRRLNDAYGRLRDVGCGADFSRLAQCRFSSRAATRTQNKPDAVNPAIASRFHFGHHWRGVTDPER